MSRYLIYLISRTLHENGENVDDYTHFLESQSMETLIRKAKHLLWKCGPHETAWIYKVNEQIDMRTGRVYMEVVSVEEEVVLTDDDFIRMMERKLGP
jgi:hypothetical protein